MGASLKITIKLKWPGIQTKYATFLGNALCDSFSEIINGKIFPELKVLIKGS